MTQDVARNQLWPTPNQMHQQLDNWVAYTRSLEEQLAGLKATYRDSEARSNEIISDLRIELQAMERPLRQQIADLRVEVTTARMEAEAHKHEVDQATQLLAAMLEIPGRPPALASLIQDALVLIEESKDQLRASL